MALRGQRGGACVGVGLTRACVHSSETENTFSRASTTSCSIACSSRDLGSVGADDTDAAAATYINTPQATPPGCERSIMVQQAEPASLGPKFETKVRKGRNSLTGSGMELCDTQPFEVTRPSW